MRHSGDAERAAGGATERLQARRGQVLLEDDVIRTVGGIEKSVRIRASTGEDVVRPAGVPGAEGRADLRGAVAERTGFGVSAVPAHRARKNVPARAEAGGVRQHVRG